MTDEKAARGDMTIRGFQELIRERYEETDRARGTPATFLWFIEEIGELAEALGEANRGKGDATAMADEFADVVAWLCTLANINGVDLAEAVEKKYLEGGGPKGTKS